MKDIDINKIKEVLKDLAIPEYYIHADAAMAGMTLPFIDGAKFFNFKDGIHLRNSFLALTLALAFYTSAFIAEIIRAGIMAVSKGQSEAAASLGLRPNKIMRLIILPQALRIIVPPLIKWIKTDKKLNEIDHIEIVKKLIEDLPYKKIIVWCGMIDLCYKLQVPAKTLFGAWETNLEVRPEKDWEQLKGRAVTDDE